VGTDQIHLLFDSLLRSYPIGSFLFWNVAPEALKFTFHQFLRHAPSMTPTWARRGCERQRR
jgi:hypothetical protein